MLNRPIAMQSDTFRVEETTSGIGLSSYEFTKEGKGAGRFEGTGYVFAFNCSTDVTNVQLAELIALVCRFVQLDAPEGASPEILTIPDYLDLLTGTGTTYGSHTTYSDQPSELSHWYNEYLKRIIVIRPLRTSCIIYLPHAATLDIQSLI